MFTVVLIHIIRLKRARLDFEQIEAELKEIAKAGLEEILILTGESEKYSSIEYIGEDL